MKTMPIINKTKHPTNGDKKVQDGRTQVLANKKSSDKGILQREWEQIKYPRSQAHSMWIKMQLKDGAKNKMVMQIFWNILLKLICVFFSGANDLNQGTHIVTIVGKTPTTTSSGLGRATNLNYLLIPSSNNMWRSNMNLEAMTRATKAQLP